MDISPIVDGRLFMYKIYTDKNENFVCEVSVKNASLKGSLARLIVEGNDGTNLVFHGKINDGKCTVPIKRLKGLLEENSAGKLSLEVIVEDTYFKPWESEFVVEAHTSVKVKIEENTTSTKPTIQVRVPSSKKVSLHPCTVELYSLCEKFGITRKSLTTKTLLESKRKSFRQLVNEYFLANKEYRKARNTVLRQLLIILK